MLMKFVLFFNCFFYSFFQINNFLFYLTHLLIYLILKINCYILIFLIAINILNYSSNFAKCIIRTFRIIINKLVCYFFFWTLKIFLRYLLNHFFWTIISIIIFWIFMHVLLWNTSGINFSIYNVIFNFSFASFWFFPASLLFLNWISFFSPIGCPQTKKLKIIRRGKWPYSFFVILRIII